MSTNEQSDSKDEELTEAEIRFAKADAIARLALDKWGTALVMLGELECVIARVRDLHAPIDYPGEGAICCDCENPYPRPTINAIKGYAE